MIIQALTRNRRGRANSTGALRAVDRPSRPAVDRPHPMPFWPRPSTVPGDAEAIDPDRDAAIDRDLREHRADLVRRQSVAQRAANVRCELLHLPERRDHAEIEDRALARAERVVAPGLAPAILRDDALKVAVEIVGALERAIDIFLTKHLAAHRETAVIVSLSMVIPPWDIKADCERYWPSSTKNSRIRRQRREQDFDRRRGKRVPAPPHSPRRCRVPPPRRGGIAPDGMRAEARTPPPAGAVRPRADRLDPGAKELGGGPRDERRRRLERTPQGAQRNDGHVPPGERRAVRWSRPRPWKAPACTSPATAETGGD